MSGEPDQKSPFIARCSICDEERPFAKVAARKGQRRVRVCPKCDRNER